jgi:hypothetical protein
LETLLRPRAAECRIEEDRQALARVSVPTLVYMRDRSEELEARLRWHRTNLEWLASDEHDLYEAMRLSARLTNTRVNAARAGRHSERIRAELLRRQLPGR